MASAESNLDYANNIKVMIIDNSQLHLRYSFYLELNNMTNYKCIINYLEPANYDNKHKYPSIQFAQFGELILDKNDNVMKYKFDPNIFMDEKICQWKEWLLHGEICKHLFITTESLICNNQYYQIRIPPQRIHEIDQSCFPMVNKFQMVSKCIERIHKLNTDFMIPTIVKQVYHPFFVESPLIFLDQFINYIKIKSQTASNTFIGFFKPIFDGYEYFKDTHLQYNDNLLIKNESKLDDILSLLYEEINLNEMNIRTKELKSMYLYIFIYIFICIYLYIYLFVYSNLFDYTNCNWNRKDISN